MIDFRKGASVHNDAINYPLSLAACAAKAEMNGLDGEIPVAWRYSPNAYMQEWMEWLGAEKAKGNTIWEKPGWLRLKK